MIDPEQVLEPLRSSDLDRRLEDYDGPEALTSALRDSAHAAEAVLRRLLRRDPAASDDDRLHAMSPERLSFQTLVERLRARDRISMELAGMVHQLRSDAAAAEPRPSHADHAQATLARLRREVEADARADEGVNAAAHHATTELHEPLHPVPAPHRRGVAFALFAVVVALGVVALSLWVVMRGGDGNEEAIAAFEEGRYAPAAQLFAERVEDEPEDLEARLYLARSYRRLGRHAEAADHLRAAAELAPDDPFVRRELGHLFMELERPDAAVRQFQLATEADPESTAGWIGLINAMRAAGDGRARETLSRAPAEVRALFTDSLP